MTVKPSIRRVSIQDENEGKKIPYPKSIFFIVVTEFCERFSYYGMRAVLTIYMHNVLDFSDDLSTTIYHIFLLLCYGLPVFGGILADSFIGKYKTIVYLSSIYALGNIVLTAAATKPLHLPIVPLSILGLAFMAIGTGGIKPCVVALGGEQFILPNQEKTLKQFFSVFLFAVSVGNMVATVITPILRSNVKCFGDECYPLAFGVPGLLMMVAICVFIGGRCLYTIKTPEENIVIRVVKCASFAVKEKFRQKDNNEQKSHWLDYASSRFDDNLIRDTKGLFRVLIYYLPVPMFFALYEQLGSRWTLQAMRMNGYVGGFVIKPDQMQVANAILLFIFIPVFETLVYPLFNKCNLLKRPLQKMGVGGVLASLAFLTAGIIESRIDSSYSILNSSNGELHLNYINTLECPLIIKEEVSHFRSSSHLSLNNTLELWEDLNVPPHFNLISRPIISEHVASFAISVGVNGSCGSRLPLKPWRGQIPYLKTGGVQSILVGEFNGLIFVKAMDSGENTKKSKSGNAKLRIILADMPQSQERNESGVNLLSVSYGTKFSYRLDSRNFSKEEFSYLQVSSTGTFDIDPTAYRIQLIQGGTKEGNSTVRSLSKQILLKTGGSYLLILTNNSISSELDAQLVTLTPPNEVHMLWLIPQYVLIAWAEVLFIISGMEFSFTEAPESMKSVMQSCWHLANAAGNAIVIISAQVNVSQKYEFFGFSALMALDTLILCLMAIKYTYVGTRKKSTAQVSKNWNESIETKC